MTRPTQCSTPAGMGGGEWPDQRVGLFLNMQNFDYVARHGHGGHVDCARLLAHATRGRRLVDATANVVEREDERSAYGPITKQPSLRFRACRREVRVHRVEDAGRNGA